MGDRRTVSESKAIFHKEFPFVIPAVYRRLVDELIVELNLLSNQKQFQPDGIFALGLKSIFTDFTNGYKPLDQKNVLLPAICKSTGFSYEAIEGLAKELVTVSETFSLEDLKTTIDKQDGNLEEKDKYQILKLNKHYSRLVGIGLIKFAELTGLIQNSDVNVPDSFDQLICFIGFKKDRIEKEISLYRTNKDKIAKALELIEINKNDENRRREKKG